MGGWDAVCLRESTCVYLCNLGFDMVTGSEVKPRIYGERMQHGRVEIVKG